MPESKLHGSLINNVTISVAELSVIHVHAGAGGSMQGLVCPCRGWCVHAGVGVSMQGLVCPCTGWCVQARAGVSRHGLVCPIIQGCECGQSLF